MKKNTDYTEKNTDYTNGDGRKKQNLWILFLILCGYLLLPLSAMDWPTADGAMVNNFGGNNEGRPMLGAVFAAEGPINAADSGELLFSRKSDDNASRLPSPLGAWMALDHGDGIISIYSRFDDTEDMEKNEIVSRNDPIAAAGSSGWSNRRGFYFSLFDRRGRRWMNPSMIITPFPDTRPPQILSVMLKAQDGRLINPNQVRSISQGRYSILVAATDTRLNPGEPSLAPHQIVCSINGAEIGSLNFETYSARDGVLMVHRNGLTPVKQVFAPFPAVEVGEVWFTRGQATLEIIARDIIGNERSVVMRLLIE
ncbi:hypothetical protein FACS189491_04470 [Spirochaetia bacterium]|nr:hypothetical protein FACS189491_04470 [Spirochaetia bacterium]